MSHPPTDDYRALCLSFHLPPFFYDKDTANDDGDGFLVDNDNGGAQ